MSDYIPCPADGTMLGRDQGNEDGVLECPTCHALVGQDGRRIEPLRLASLEMTCQALPAQWEGRLEDGRFVYGRYRYGWLSVCAAPTLDEAVLGYDGSTIEVLAEAQLGHEYDGEMDTATMLRHAGLEAPTA